MQKLKLVRQLFSKNDAKAVASFEREKARKDGRSIRKVEVMKALELYRMNRSMFEGMGAPWDEDYVVVVFYSKKDSGKTVIEASVNDISIDNNVPVEVNKEEVSVKGRAFTVINYTSRIVKNNIIKVIERFVVTDRVTKRGNRVSLPVRAIAS